MRRLLFCVWFASLVSTGFAASSPLHLWRGVTPLPTGQPLYRPAGGQGIVLIPGGAPSLGSGGTNTLLISTNGVDWMLGSDTGTFGLRDLLFTNGLWIAVGNRGITSSTDATNWTVRHVSFQNFTGVAFANGRYVVVGDGANTAISMDGLTWTEPSGNAFGGKAITAAFGKFYIASSSGLRESTDGVNWTSVTVPFLTNPTTVSFVGGRLIAGTFSDIFSTPDGVSWVRSGAAGVQAVTFGNGLFVAGAEGGRAFLSRNASNWTETVVGQFSLTGAAFIENRFIATGTYGSIYSSPDGTNWAPHFRNAGTFSVQRVAHLNGHYIAVGDQGGIMTSPDGTHWTNRPVQASSSFRAVAYGEGRYLVGGSSALATSTNGVDWTPNGSGFGMNGLAFGRGLFVTVTDGSAGQQSSIRTSLEGTNWVPRTNLAGVTFLDVTFARGLFVAVGSDARILTSEDGMHWVQRSAGPNLFQSFIKAAHGNGRYYALGSSSRLAISGDGTNWSSVPLPSIPVPQSIAVGDGMVVVLDMQLRPWFSRDLVSWESTRLRTTFTQNTVGHGPGKFLVGGFPGQIWESGPVVNLFVNAPQSLLLSGPPGLEVQIQRNTDLNETNWTPFGTVTLGTNFTPWFDPQLNPPPRAFYRAATPP